VAATHRADAAVQGGAIVTPPLGVLDLASATLLAVMLLIAFYNLRTAQRLEHAPHAARTPLVSLLIPARNEAENLPQTLPLVSSLEYPELEILVLDDGSTDDTANLVRERAARDPRLQLISGSALPPGWLGKNWACHQLARAARGEVLLFCDADVSPERAAVIRTIALMQHAAADVLTAIPRQRFGSWVESAVIPLIVHLPLLALLPLRQVSQSASPALSMANGQWLAFTRNAYERSGGHAAVRSEVVEDVALGRRAKVAGLRLLPVIANRTLEVRMYRGAAAVVEGFGKNLYALLGARPHTFGVGLVVFVLCAVYPWAAALLGKTGALLPLALLIALRALAVRLFRHGWSSVLLHPLGALLTLGIAARSALGACRGGVLWKHRRVTPLPAGSPPRAIGSAGNQAPGR
jgi:chlorobactene glucosyltransferase